MSDTNTAPMAPIVHQAPRAVLFKGSWSIDKCANRHGVRLACFGEKSGEGPRPVIAELELTTSELELLLAMSRLT